MADEPRDMFEKAEAEDRAAAAAELDNVLEFRKREPQDGERLDALARAPRTGEACKHNRRRYVDQDLRRVTCGECGETLDPIWCLLNLIEYRETLRREREWIEAEKRRATKRQEAAIARKRRAHATAAATRARENCKRCDGTGWADVPGGRGVVPCDCRKAGAKLL